MTRVPRYCILSALVQAFQFWCKTMTKFNPKLIIWQKSTYFSKLRGRRPFICLGESAAAIGVTWSESQNGVRLYVGANFCRFYSILYGLVWATGLKIGVDDYEHIWNILTKYDIAAFLDTHTRSLETRCNWFSLESSDRLSFSRRFNRKGRTFSANYALNN